MPTASTSRDDRIKLRASREEKRLLAAAVVARHERIQLSARDSTRVLDVLENPPKPTPVLRAAARLLQRNRG